MRDIVFSKTGSGTTPWIPVDYKQSPFSIGIGCVASGTVTYSIEHTFDNVLDPNFTATPTAFKNTGITSVVNVNANGNYAFPIRAIRLNNESGTGTVTVTILQAVARS